MPDDVRGGDDFSRGGPIESRVGALETAMNEIRADLKAIRLELADLKAIRLELAEMKGKLSNVPTTFQLVFMQTALVLSIFAGSFGLLKLSGH